MRVLIVRAGALGDTLMVTPLIRCLHERNADCEIDMLCSEDGAQLLDGNPHLSQLHILRGRNVPYWLSAEKVRLARKLKKRRYEFAVLLEAAPRYRSLLNHAGVTRLRSFRETPFDPELHAVINNLRAAECFTTDVDYDLPVKQAAREWATQALADLPRPIIGIHAGHGPASKKNGQTRRSRSWDRAKFRLTAQHFASSGATVVLTGSGEDLELCRSIADGIPRARVFAGKSRIDQLPALIAGFDLLISVDSGPAHIAAAVGTPLLVLWGSGILAQTKPISSTTPIQILRPESGSLQQLTPETVIAAASTLLTGERQLLPATSLTQQIDQFG